MYTVQLKLGLLSAILRPKTIWICLMPTTCVVGDTCASFAPPLVVIKGSEPDQTWVAVPATR